MTWTITTASFNERESECAPLCIDEHNQLQDAKDVMADAIEQFMPLLNHAVYCETCVRIRLGMD